MKTRRVVLQLCYFFFQDLGPLKLHTNIVMGFSISAKKIIGILIWIELNLQISFDSIDILKILSHPIHEHGMSFLLFMCSLTSFSNVLYFSVCKSFSSLVNFIPKYFIILGAILLINLFLFIYGCVWSSFLCEGFL